MMHWVRSSGHTFSNRGLPNSLRCAATHDSTKKPIPTGGDTSVKKQLVKPAPPNDRTTKAWTAVAWPTNIQSGALDGKFGPARQMRGWGSCWFMSALAAVVNDADGRKMLSEGIKRVEGGYEVTFKGLPDNKVFVSESELTACLNENGGDADTRLIELAADRFFSQGRGRFRSLYIASLLHAGRTQNEANQCFRQYCNARNIGPANAMTYNPMRAGSLPTISFFMLTGMNVDILLANRSNTMQEENVRAYLNYYVTNDQDGVSVVISGIENTLGNTQNGSTLVRQWDVIRTDITSNGTLSQEQVAFLNALDRWLETRGLRDMQALWAAAENLNLEHIKPREFADLLARNRFNMSQEHFEMLRSGVRQVLQGESGYIGFAGHHAGTIEGINAATNTFIYNEPNFPTVVHTGSLSDLIEALKFGKVKLTAIEPITRPDSGGSDHASTSRGRRLLQLYNQAVNDGKINQDEIGPLADLLEMDDGTLRQLYDSDKNGVIEGGELKAVKLRVDRWIDHLESTPIW